MCVHMPRGAATPCMAYATDMSGAVSTNTLRGWIDRARARQTIATKPHAAVVRSVLLARKNLVECLPDDFEKWTPAGAFTKPPERSNKSNSHPDESISLSGTHAA